MSTNNSVNNANPLKVVELPDKINVLLSTKAYTQISYLLQKIHDVEWSAILLYTADGHITNPAKMSCRVDSLYLMDKGSAAYTEHDYDTEAIVGMFNDFPEYMNMKMGHVHSHNTMSSFFSGTDMNELKNNVSNHVYYLSLIVNNKGSFVAKLCYIGKQQVKVSVQNKVGKWVWGKRESPIEEEVMFVHDCNVSMEMYDAEKFIKRFKEVISKPKPVIPSIPVKTPGYEIPSYKKPQYDSRDSYFVPDSLSRYTGWAGKPEGTPSGAETAKLVDLAKYVVTCNMQNSIGSLSLITSTAEKEMMQDTDEAITESYELFFKETSPEFLQEAYKEVYGNHAIEFWDLFTMQLEKAVNLIPGRIGDCIREAIDNILIEWEELREVEETDAAIEQQYTT